MPLAKLPPELVQRIFRQLCPHCAEEQKFPQDQQAWSMHSSAKPNRQALVQLSLVSKYLGPIAQAILYHHFGFIETQRQASFLFCRTLHDNPKLGHQVRALKVSVTSAKGSRLSKDITWMKFLMGQFEQSPNCNHGHDQGDICPPCQRLRGELMDYILPTLAIPYTPHLKQLCMAGGVDWFLFNHMYQLTTANERVSPNQGTHLRVHPSKFRDEFPWNFLQDAPGRHRECYSTANDLKLEGLTLNDSSSIPLPNNISTHDLKFLRFLRPVLAKEELMIYIRAPNDLREFVYIGTEARFLFNRSDPMIKHDITSQQIFKFLGTRNGSLRRVSVIMPWSGTHLTAARELTGLDELCISTGAMFDMKDLVLNSRSLGAFDLINTLPPLIRVLHLEVEPYSLGCIRRAIVKYVASTYDHETKTQTLKRLSVGLQTIEPKSEEYSRWFHSVTPPSMTDEEAAEELRLLLRAECPEWLVDGKLEIVHKRAAEFDDY